MTSADPHFRLRLARDEADLLAAQRLRYAVFVEELGGDGPLVDHAGRFERDAYDALYDHLLLIDARRDAGALDHVVGVYRLMPDDRLPAGARFYTEGEFDIAVLRASGRRLLELGRSCVHRDYRGGAAMLHLWNAVAEYVLARGIEVMFGTASFHGTDLAALRAPLAWLARHHLAPPDLRVRAVAEAFQPLDPDPAAPVERAQALAAIPALIRGYLRLGGFVGDGAYVDRAFNTTDVCLVMDTARMSARHREFYTRKSGGAE